MDNVDVKMSFDALKLLVGMIEQLEQGGDEVATVSITGDGLTYFCEAFDAKGNKVNAVGVEWSSDMWVGWQA